MRVPGGHRGLIVCDSRRAGRWRKALQAAGIAAIVVETDADEAGAARVCVPERALIEENALVTALTTGQRSLPGITLPWQAVIASVIVLSLLAALVAR